jgi:4-diphosphocytidyl-2-C-methyl-D-erythritol kinase
MIVFPSCKINLGLHLLSKRADGFHDIETIFYPVSGLSDTLEIIPAKDLESSFEQQGLSFENQENNLVEKAYLLMRKHYDIPATDMFLYKNIPIGAGLGGGSSDAAFTLKLLNTIFKLGLNASELKQYAAQLGSDCSFFIDNIPALGIGRGDILFPYPIPQLSGKFIAIIKPDITISTAQAYKNCKPVNRTVSLKEIISKPLSCWKDLLENDFEKTIFPDYPELLEIKESLYNQGAEYASLSGSGAALFGIFSAQLPSLNFGKDYFVFQGKL